MRLRAPLRLPDWRFLALGGLATGLALSPLGESVPGTPVLPPLALAGLGLLAARPSRGGQTPLPWLALVCLLTACAGLIAGAARLRAIDRGALSLRPGSSLSARGYVAAVPRRLHGVVRVQVDTKAGKLLVESREPVDDLPIGAEVRAAGRIAMPPPWYRDYLRRQGIARVLHAPRIELTGARRGGLLGRVDLLRRRAEDALGRGVPDREAALARGFVLGEDDRVDPRTAEDFRGSGLTHLLAVSGQNVVLLALLATPLLAALGIPLRARLSWLLCLIAVYVPLAGAGPSIQRAGAMGAAGVFALLSGRRASRVYALLLAAAATLALNPRASGDVGWQLSFAAVLGIFLCSAPLRELIEARLGSGGWRRALAEGLAVTVAASLATAPLMAHHFSRLSLTTLAANLLVLPAVAPAMWLGMLSAAAGQVPVLPVEPLNWTNSVLLAYIAQIATWLGRPAWTLVGIRLDSWTAVLAAYAVLVACGAALRAWVRRRRNLVRGRSRLPRGRLVLVALAAAGALLAAAPSPGGAGAGEGQAARGGLRISVLDVGQGDAILLQPAGGGAILVDGGPPGDGIEAELAERGVGALEAALVTHDQSDHAGGIEELLGRLPVARLLYAEVGPRLLAEARAAGAAPTRLAEGSEVRDGALRLEVLWPPRELLGEPVDDPNLRCIVAVAHWRHFEMLLTGDAEAETVPIDPGPVDVLKVAHHGSDDAGLGRLLSRTAPRLAVISVGAANPFGHPTAGTLATLSRHHVPVLRTDQRGTVTLELAGNRMTVQTER